MRRTFWPDSTEAEVEARLHVAPDRGVTLVAQRREGGLAGFAEVDLRRFADGCDASPVPYLEGLWVDEDQRRSGVATALVRGVEAWCRARGFPELASDSEISNEPGVRFHLRAGFEEVQRNITFRKRLVDDEG
jgi:aminoglycoside 6'-N-acetyltransferase I